MGKEQLSCPGCGKPVEVGTLLCPECGMNIRTGESFDVKIKRAKAREVHPERVGTGIGVGVTIVLGLVFLGGFLYQKRVETVFREKPAEYAGYLRRLESIDFLAAVGKGEQARMVGQELIKELKEKESGITIEAAPTTRQVHDRHRRPKSVRRAEKRLLLNLAKKAEFKLFKLSARPE